MISVLGSSAALLLCSARNRSHSSARSADRSVLGRSTSMRPCARHAARRCETSGVGSLYDVGPHSLTTPCSRRSASGLPRLSSVFLESDRPALRSTSPELIHVLSEARKSPMSSGTSTRSIFTTG